MTVGRGKFIYRLYGALKDNGQAEMANRIFAEAKAGYHPIAQRRISEILAERQRPYPVLHRQAHLQISR